MRLPTADKLAEFAATVRSRVGFDLQSVGSENLLRTLRQGMTKARVADGNSYVAQLLQNEAEFDSFVEDVVVPETWFFRDRQPFRFVQHYATQCWRPSSPEEGLRILSIPCSTGEEPYSIAMALFGTGLMPSRLQVDGADLSRRVLDRAGEGVYGKPSFRGDEAAFSGLCERFLDRQGDRYVVNASLRSAVRFLRANLVSPSLLADRPRYHVVFCRNVLIYMDANARQVALANLHRLLLPEGLLYVGHVEARVVTEAAFCQFSREYPFAFSPTSGKDPLQDPRPARQTPSSSASGSARAERVPAVARAATAVNSAIPRTLQPANRTASGTLPPRTARVDPPAPRPAPAVKTELADLRVSGDLTSSRVAANAGRLEEASALCRGVLDKQPTNVEALCLLGLVSKARGQPTEAKRCFQKVLYLNPWQEEALVHMMLLAEQRGDERAAANFRRRAEQAHEREVSR